MTNLSFNRGAGFISFTTGLRNKTNIAIAAFLPTLGIPFSFLPLPSVIRPVISTLATLVDGLRTADVEESFPPISGMGIWGADGDRVVIVAIDDKFVVMGEVFWSNVFEDPEEDLR